MILISHRGNINGPNDVKENSPFYVLDTIDMGYDVEVDVWFVNDKFWLGHDEPQYETNFKFLMNEKLWCHAKNLEALIEMKKYSIHYFWHEKDNFTLTSKNYIWSYPSPVTFKNTICVLPELYNTKIENCRGICSDFISKYK